jgi:hypothetical protein
MSRLKLASLGVAVSLVALALGYVWGASGRFTVANALEETRQQLDLAEARGHVLDGRVSIFSANFGDAARSFDAALAPIERAQTRYRDTGDTAGAGHLATAVSELKEAQRLAGALDQGANAKAAAAMQALRAAPSP